MNDLRGKKLLILGGKPIGSCELVTAARRLGVYTIVTDYLPADESAAKRIADEAWDISTAETDTLARKAAEAGVDGVYTGVHEFNIRMMISLCQKLGLPCYCSREQWDSLENKENFKEACINNGIPVTIQYHVNGDSTDLIPADDYPVITKPADGSGSRGFSICRTPDELKAGFEIAKSFSSSGSVLVEKYMDYRYSVIINYTVVDGEIIFSGISDKRSKKVSDSGAPIMSFQFYRSLHEKQYLDELDQKTKKMLGSLGIKNGVVWIEAFYNKGSFIFNELGFRFGGSLTYYPVEYFYGIDQLALQIEYALTARNDFSYSGTDHVNDNVYCILPVHVKPGTIGRIEGQEQLRNKKYLHRLVPVHYKGDVIKNWGSAQQVFAYIHYISDSREKAGEIERDIMNTLRVYDTDGGQMLFNLFDDTCR